MLEKKTKCWRNRNIKKKLNVGEIEIFRKNEMLEKQKCYKK